MEWKRGKWNLMLSNEFIDIWWSDVRHLWSHVKHHSELLNREWVWERERENCVCWMHFLLKEWKKKEKVAYALLLILLVLCAFYFTSQCGSYLGMLHTYNLETLATISKRWKKVQTMATETATLWALFLFFFFVVVAVFICCCVATVRFSQFFWHSDPLSYSSKNALRPLMHWTKEKSTVKHSSF